MAPSLRPRFLLPVLLVVALVGRADTCTPVPTDPQPPAERPACASTADCEPGLSCQGRPAYWDGEGFGCCTDTARIDGEGEMCGGDADCGDGLVCIFESCSAAWMADVFDGGADRAIPEGGAELTDTILVTCLATVPVTAHADLRLTHPQPTDLRVTVTDPSGWVETVLYDGTPLTGETLEILGAAVQHTGDDAVNGPWTLTVVDRNEDGLRGVLVEWSLDLTSRWD